MLKSSGRIVCNGLSAPIPSSIQRYTPPNPSPAASMPLSCTERLVDNVGITRIWASVSLTNMPVQPHSSMIVTVESHSSQSLQQSAGMNRVEAIVFSNYPANRTHAAGWREDSGYIETKPCVCFSLANSYSEISNNFPITNSVTNIPTARPRSQRVICRRTVNSITAISGYGNRVVIHILDNEQLPRRR